MVAVRVVMDVAVAFAGVTKREQALLTSGGRNIGSRCGGIGRLRLRWLEMWPCFRC